MTLRLHTLAAFTLLSGQALLLGCQPVSPAAADPEVAPTTAASERVEPPTTLTKPAEEHCGMPLDLPDADWPRTLEPNSAEEPSAFVAGSTTIAVLPDTQYYVDCRSPHVKKQAEWLASQRTARNVRAALQLGDLTENNWRDEWKFLKESLAPLSPSVPLLLATGNHDHGDNGTCNSRSTFFDEFFGVDFARPSGLLETLSPTSVENAFYEIALDQVKIGVLTLEWSPRADAVAWANRILAKYPKHRSIVVTHTYRSHDDSRSNYAAKGDAQKWNPLIYDTAKTPDANTPHDGEMLWQGLIRKHANVFLVLNGHVLVDGTAQLTSRGDAGQTIHQMLSNYQMLDEGGLGYLRLLELLPDGKTLRVKTYSPSLNRFATAADQTFSLTVHPPLWPTKK